MDKLKITQNEINENNVKSAKDTLDGSPQSNKSVFDKLPELIATKFNALVDALILKFRDYYNKQEVDSKETALSQRIDQKANANEVYKKDETYNKSEVYNKQETYTKQEVYTKQETDERINNAVIESGAADMTRAVYDKDSNGIVDNAERLGGQLPIYYATKSAVNTAQSTANSAQSTANSAQSTAVEAKANAFSLYTHTAGSLTGGGANGKFKATVSETVTKLNVNGVSCTIKSGGETQMELISGCWYTFILDGTTVNFSGGGAGISKSKLVDALQYSDLGITENMTNQEIITQLKSKYPPYVDIVDASKGIYNLDNWLEFLYGEHVTEQPNGLQLYQYASGGSGLVQYKTKIVIKKNSVLTFTINKYHEIKDVAVGISNELEIGYNYSYLYDKFVKKVEVTGVGHYSMSFEDIPEGSYYISIRIKSNQFKPFLIIDELKVTHKI